jgi:hypothetical protein
MPTPYPGFPIYPVNISSPIGSDPDDAATAAVPIQQLADRTAYIKGAIDSGIGFEFTDAILHGNTTLPDGTLNALLTLFDIEVMGYAEITATGDLYFDAATITALSPHIVLTALTDLLINAPIFSVTGNVHLVGATYAQGSLRLETVTLANADHVLDGSAAYEYLCTTPSTPRAVSLLPGAPIGWRVRFNAQQVAAGANYFALSIPGGGALGWTLRNQAGSTAAVEFVSNGTTWIVDDWAEGGSALRDG